MPNLVRQNRIKRMNRKRNTGNKMETGKWYIAKNINSKTFYVAEHDAKENVTMWTPDRRQAISFIGERATHKYIARYLHDRNDVILVNLVTKSK